MDQRDIPDATGVTPSRTIGIVLILIVLATLGLSIFPLTENLSQTIQIKEMVDRANLRRRTNEGRLFGTHKFHGGKHKTVEDLGRAQLMLLQLPESPVRQNLQSSIYLASGDWQRAADILERLKSQGSSNAQVLNNLGVAYLSLGDTDATKLFQALDCFEEAARMAPHAPEPLFNLVLLYRRMKLSRLEQTTFQQYVRIERENGWRDELERKSASHHEIENQLTITSTTSAQIPITCSEQPEACRLIAMQYATHEQGSEHIARGIADDFKSRYGDETMTAMLSPLSGQERVEVLRARRLVEEGARLYLQSKPAESLHAYAQARAIINGTSSLFDQYWIDINQADTEIRTGQFQAARIILDRIIATARQHRWQWLLARALTIYGSAPGLAPSLAMMIEYLTEAERVYQSVGSIGDTVRPLYYLAALRHAAGDQDESLRVATKCLGLTSPDDSIRLASLYWIMGSILYKKGMPEKAVLFELESVEQAKELNNPLLLSASTSSLSLLYETLSQHELAENYLKETETAVGLIGPGVERIRAELNLNLLKGRILLNRQRYSDAEISLDANLELYSQLPIKPSYLLAQSLMLLAKVHSGSGRINEAEATFRRAIDVVETDEQFLQSEKLRLAFDDERRELYDSAIAFEYDRNATDSSWNYLQKYRAKMFLEFLAAFNPDIERMRTDALERSRIQQLIPRDIQTVEYVQLKDRLLIWVISNNVFASRSVAISRNDLDSKIREMLTRLRSEGSIDDLDGELYDILISPIAELLDPDRSVAIIPDGALHGLPFGAIRHPENGHYLIEDFAITVSPSLTHLVASDAEQPSRDTIISFGARTDNVSSFRELTALNSIYPNVTATAGLEVDKPRFLSALNSASIFHYAGHSAYDAVDPLRSSILLDGNRYGPNSVTAVDISRQRLRPNALVVLSSCDSSVGNSKDGVGMRGLTSAFLIGGAGAVVGSLWPVETSSTSDLVIAFHRAFATGRIPVAHALRQAQLSFLKSFPDKAHPYYWSGFVVTGNISAFR